MSAPVRDCPQPEYLIRDRAYTPEQQAQLDAQMHARSRQYMTRDERVDETCERMDADTIRDLLTDRAEECREYSDAVSDLVDLQIQLADASWILDQIMDGKSIENVASEPTGSPERRDNGLIAIRNLARRSDELYQLREELVRAEAVRLVDDHD